MLRLVARGLGLAIALTLVSPGDAAAKDAVLVKLRDGGSAAKPAPAKTRATKRKVVKKRQAKATRAAKQKRKPKRTRTELRPMP